MFLTQKVATTHDMSLCEQREARIEVNESLLVYLARHLAIHARLVEASGSSTSVANTIKGIVRGLLRSV
jgi:hypothetical protein